MQEKLNIVDNILVGPSETKIYRLSAQTTSQLRQGEIITNLRQYTLTEGTFGQEDLSIDEKSHPYAIIISQDCDLEQGFKGCNPENEFTNTNEIPNILFCEVVTAQALKGTHKTTGINSDKWNSIKKNNEIRYHFLQKVPAHWDAFNQGLPELGIDFKRYFTIPTSEVYQQIKLGSAIRRCVLQSPYLEHLSIRFGNYLTRVALPLNHASES